VKQQSPHLNPLPKGERKEKEQYADMRKVSIVVPVKSDNPNLRECVEKSLLLDYPDYEIIVCPDEPITGLGKGVKVVATGPARPAEKREAALKVANGELLAFIDDDAYPRPDWLKNALNHFDDPQVAAVGGPGLTPGGDSPPQKASGFIYSSPIVSGTQVYRYAAMKKREVCDFPSCNFIVRRSVLKEMSGFKSRFWPGEDTVMCAAITGTLKKKIIYDPEVVVYHHRRPLFKKHLEQIESYGLHRGYFVKRYPATSFKLPYFLPSLLVVAIATGAILSVLYPSVRTLYMLGMSLYLLTVLLFSLKSRKISLIARIFLGIILTHAVYGVSFIRGLAAGRLKDEEE